MSISSISSIALPPRQIALPRFEFPAFLRNLKDDAVSQMRSPLGGAGQMHGALGVGRGAVVSNWWEAGGATGCVAAYQPKGAASLAASYVNLANPGMYDAAPGVAPTWNITNGWIFAGYAVADQYLITGVIPLSGWSMIVRYSNMSNDGYLAGCQLNTTERFWMSPRSTGNFWRYGNGASTAAGSTAGVMCLAGDSGYYNGGLAVSSIGSWSDVGLVIWIGALNINGLPNSGAAVYVQAAAIYSSTLTAPQVSAISTAMALL